MFEKKKDGEAIPAAKKKPSKPDGIKTCGECALCVVNLESQSGKCHYDTKAEPVSLNHWCFHYMKA